MTVLSPVIEHDPIDGCKIAKNIYGKCESWKLVYSMLFILSYLCQIFII